MDQQSEVPSGLVSRIQGWLLPEKDGSPSRTTIGSSKQYDLSLSGKLNSIGTPEKRVSSAICAETDSRAEEVLQFWFGGDMHTNYKTKWFPDGSAETQRKADETVSALFGNLFTSAINGELADWKKGLRSTVALIVILDQFSRHIYRLQEVTSHLHYQLFCAEIFTRDLPEMSHICFLTVLIHQEKNVCHYVSNHNEIGVITSHLKCHLCLYHPSYMKMPSGDSRRANVDALALKTAEELTSKKGETDALLLLSFMPSGLVWSDLFVCSYFLCKEHICFLFLQPFMIFRMGHRSYCPRVCFFSNALSPHTYHGCKCVRECDEMLLC